MNIRRRNILLTISLLVVVVVTTVINVAIAKFGTPAAGETLGVFDVQVDRHARKFVDIVFDQPIGVARSGEIVEPPPAEIEPAMPGVWRWRTNSTLRFEPAGGFSPGGLYSIRLKTARLLAPNQRFRGSDELRLRVDGLMVEKVVTGEESIAATHDVVIRGEIHFNYAVEPAMVITHASLIDGNDRQPIEVIDSYGGPVINFRTTPVKKSENARTIKLVLSKGIAERGRGSKLEADYVHEISVGSSARLTVRSVAAEPRENESSLKIELSSQVNPDIAMKFITVAPAVKFHLGAEGNELRLTGGFKPGTAYALTIGKGLPAVDDATLGEAYSANVAFDDLAPKLDFQSDGMFLSSSGYKTLAIESINASEAVLAIDRVYRNNIFYYLQNESRWAYGGDYYEDEDMGDESAADAQLNVASISRTMGDPILRKKIPLRNAPNRKMITTVSLEPFVKEREPGLYRVVLAGRSPLREQTRWILITDLGIVTKRGDDDLVVWLSSFHDLSAISDASVTLVSDQNQPLASGRTDARGIWVIHDLAKLTKAKKHPWMITVQKGSDYSFLIFGKTEVDVSPFDVAGDKVAKDGYSAFVYGERDIYRPGETVNGLAIVRTATLEAPPQMPLVMQHHDGDSERESFRINLTGDGIAPFTLKLPAYARTGHHHLDVTAGKSVIGTYNFQVEEFVPDRIKVEIKPKSQNPAPGSDLLVDVTSAYLFGPPAANLAFDARVRLVPSTFTAKGFESFSFGNSDRKFDPREIANVSATLDANGVHQLKVAIPDGMLPPSALDAIVVARVQEQGGRGVSAVAHVPVHPWPYYVGVKRAGNADAYPEPGKPLTFEWVAVSKDGVETKSNTLRAEFFEDEWQTVLRRTANGGYDYVSTREPRLLSARAINGGSSRGTFTFTPSAYRTYRVVVSDASTGASTSHEFCAGGWGYSPWAMKNPGRLQLDLDKNEYAPGDEATLQVKAPFGGKLLVTVERDDVYYTSIETISGNSAKIKIPLSAQLRPNAYVTATLVRAAGDLEPGEAGRAFGAIPINVDREANRLHPVINTPADLRSEHKLPIEVTTEPNALVTIAAVDEGILQLIAQKTADPHAYFYRKLALGVATNDIYALLLPEVKPKGKANAGGGEDLLGVGQFVRADSIRRAKPVSYWSGPLKADANGKAHVTFDIPDFQGGVRVMAVAHRGRHFGSSEAMTRVHDPIVLMPTFPRFLAVHDQVSVPVTLRNDTGRSGKFTVSVNASEARNQVRANAAGDFSPSSRLGMTQVVDVATGGEKTLLFPLQAPAAPGEVPVTITASGNGESAHASVHIDVRWDLPPETVEIAGRFNESAAVFRNDVFDQFVAGSVERTLVVSPLPVVQFRGKLSYLLHYPYGCVEQTTSSVFPLLYFGDLARELDPDSFEKNESVAMVREGIRRLGTMQTYNGGFSMWPFGTNVEPWNSVYATHFLVEAKRAGHEVPQTMLDRALAYIATDAKAKSDYDTYELERVVYALYVLARAGKPDIGTMDYIREHQYGRLDAQSRALLAAAYAATGNPKMLEPLAGKVSDVESVVRETGGNLNSTIRNRALLLLALQDTAPNDPRVPALVERLTRDLSDMWWSTNESAMVLVALGQLAHGQHAAAPYQGTVIVDGKAIGSFTGKTAVFRHIRGATIKVVMSGAYNKGAAFYALATRGVRTSASYKPENAGIEVKRELLTRDGKPLGPTGVHQGELIVCKLSVRSLNGALRNVVVQNLIPAGLEVENPRLKSSETFTWITGEANVCDNVDIRDDQVIYFTDLAASGTREYYTLLRAVTPGVYQLPPMYAEAMYARANHAAGERGTLTVRQW